MLYSLLCKDCCPAVFGTNCKQSALKPEVSTETGPAWHKI